MAAKIQLIIGLQNPGANYASTRHNAGAWWLEQICQTYNIQMKKNNKLKAAIGQGLVNSQQFICASPTTYMNESGFAVQAIASYYKIKPENILIVHDDLDLEPGIVRLKIGGGHGGHNGLRSIIPNIGQNFNRLRIGIGHPGNKNLVSNYVLHAPSKSELQAINNSIDQAVNIFPEILAGNWQQAMNQLH